MSQVCVQFFLLHKVSPADYEGVEGAVLPFAACQRRSCLNVTIVDDVILENIEQFSVTLIRPLDLDQRITLDPVDGIVQITDNDGRRSFSIPTPLVEYSSLSSLQWLWWVWREHSTMFRSLIQWQRSVLLSTNQVDQCVPSTLILMSSSLLLMALLVHCQIDTEKELVTPHYCQ